jgi:CRP-like cAMP-binding protein
VNWDRIDDLCSRLKFFSDLSRDVRRGLLRASSLMHYKSGDIVFNQGDYGDLMYVILRGSVNIRIKKKDYSGVVVDVIVATAYDGLQFGELALMGTYAQNVKRKSSFQDDLGEEVDLETGEHKKIFLKREPRKKEEIKLTRGFSKVSQSLKSIPMIDGEKEEQYRANYMERSKRSATVQVSEACDLLAIPRASYKEQLLDLIQNELDAKLKIVMRLPFLSVLRFIFDKI